MNPRPVLKWLGGKAWLAGRVRSLLPPSIRGSYHEPFAGGLAVFCSLSPEQLPLFGEAGRQHVPAQRAVLADLSDDLVAFYLLLRDRPEEVVLAALRLEELFLELPPATCDGGKVRASQEQKTFYDAVRRSFNHATDRAAAVRAASYLFLNRAGYNGLMRYNRKGELNTPCGAYRRPSIVRRAEIAAMSLALRGTRVLRADFEDALGAAREGDAAYLDPPHVPRATGGFTSYTGTAWTREDDRRAARLFWDLARRGVRVVMSQARTEGALLFLHRERPARERFTCQTVRRRERVSSDGAGRGQVDEVLVAAGPASASEGEREIEGG